MVKGFYDLYLKTTTDPIIREWLEEEINFVESVVSKTKTKRIDLSGLFPEYRWLINGKVSYSTAVGRATGPLLFNDILNKLLTVDYVFAPIYRRVTRDSFKASYGMTPEEYLKLFDESERIIPMSMAPPWSLEKPQFYRMIIRKLYKKYGYYPPPAWVRMTDYFIRRLSILEDFSWEEVLSYWKFETKLILKNDSTGLNRLMILHKREAREFLNIISTKSAQLHLFGYKNILRTIFEISRKLKSAELLYALVTLYHKYLISGVLDYVGGVVIWLDEGVSPEKLGIKPEPEILAPLAVRLGVIRDIFHDKGVPGNKRLSIQTLSIVDKIRESSPDFYEFIGRLNYLVKQDINGFLETTQKFDEIIMNHINTKIRNLQKRVDLVSKLVTAGLTLLSGEIIASQYNFNWAIPKHLGILGLTVQMLLGKLGVNLGLDYIQEVVRKTIEEAHKIKILKDPLGVLQGKGVFWLIWSTKKS
ncbi:MAG: hypothetical protein GSR75_02200 [Desulfurococcales archaeon]|nr:hypothetical protein [Desulfurococcales archaeon]